MLLNTMGVFIHEPLLDWQKLARRLVKEQAGGDGDAVAWFPKQKIDIACRKLDGDNPALITETELSESANFTRVHFTCANQLATLFLTVLKSQLPHVLKALKEIVRGSREHNIRARVGARCASVKEQVDCLVDQATDPNILGRTYWGWAPFI